MLGILTSSEIAEVLKSHHIGRLGCSDGKNVYIVPLSYLYREDHILCYSMEGMKIDWMRKHPEVCLELDNIKDANNWVCVVGQGYYEEIKEETEIDKVKDLFSEFALQQKLSITALPPESHSERVQAFSADKAPVFYKIHLTRLSGRFERSV